MGDYNRLIDAEYGSDPMSAWLVYDEHDEPAGVVQATGAFDAIEKLPMGYEVVINQPEIKPEVN